MKYRGLFRKDLQKAKQSRLVITNECHICREPKNVTRFGEKLQFHVCQALKSTP